MLKNDDDFLNFYFTNAKQSTSQLTTDFFNNLWIFNNI